MQILRRRKSEADCTPPSATPPWWPANTLDSSCPSHGAHKLVQIVLNLATHDRCLYFFENPWGLPRTRPTVQGIPMRVMDYCKYNDGDHPHMARKRTCIWTNTDWIPRRLLCKKDCGYCKDGKHIDYAQRIPKQGRPKHTIEQLYAIPAALPREICEYMN